MRHFFAFLAVMAFILSAAPVLAAGDSHDPHATVSTAAAGEYNAGDLLHNEVEHGVAESHGDGHEAPKGLPQLDPSTYVSQVFWLAIMFVLMYTVFRFKVLPDISSVVDRRREQIESDLNAAKTLKDEAERIHVEYEDALTAAREKSSALYTRVEDKIRDKEVEENQAFQDRASKQIADVELEVTEAKQSAMAEMNEVAADAAVMAVDKIVGISTDKKKALTVVKALGKKKAA